MKLHKTIDMQKHTKAWQKKMQEDYSYYADDEPAFSPAVQAQVSPFGNVSTGAMPAYQSVIGVLQPWCYTGWMDEARSIHESCYIGDWSWLNKLRVSGPDAVKCMEASTINGYKKFPVGKGRHILSITPEGNITNDAIAFREAEDTFLLTGGTTLAEGVTIITDGLDVTCEDVTADIYNFHVQGPNSGKVIERVTGEDPSDLEFIHFREVTVCGQPTRLYRGGMSGELGYELFGDAAYASVVWDAVVKAGEEFGIRQLGMRTLMLNHLQAFFPTIWLDFIPGFVPGAEALYRKPTDFGWGNLIDKTRDFPGKDVLMAEMESPTRASVVLEWDDEDVVGIFRTLFDKDAEPMEQLTLPVASSGPGESNPMYVPVLDGAGNMVGMASNHGYSYQFRKFIALAVIDPALAVEGTRLTVLYGSQGKRQMTIGATVCLPPYKKDNRR